MLYREKINNFEINYYSEEFQENKPIVLFLHGFADSYRTFVKLFNSNDYISVAIDLPGCGQSVYENELKIEDYQNVVEQFIIKHFYNKDIYIVSHSLGSASALYAAKKLKNIKFCLLIAPFNYLIASEKEHVKIMSNRLLPDSFDDIYESYTSLFYNLNELIKTAAEKRAISFKTISTQRMNNFEYMVKNQILNIEYNNLIKELFSLKNYSIITGDQDKFVPIHLINRIKEENNWIELTTINNCGHATIYEGFSEVKNKILEMIKHNNW
ncbi:alpha/beta fold hydrolase [Mycoplasmopsis anatis]|uniref:Putative esterase/lipase n=1 Tax=Mycoplasmopsis anatis 1340 TaxID=1034808 RepID=F9QD83_9BACT|nr:alpha/beta fold hydrolase [Mycoplasmopsis anatis]AWX70219.1 alpha/beta fold hydrolase [Mycoplasmopsis anatis]EGS29341.1 putative esterase/lipase [Mycoplasmopsis anatis 1340]VEU74138.1 putative esterase/lipase [Mycoplasmopsis anatis]